MQNKRRVYKTSSAKWDITHTSTMHRHSLRHWMFLGCIRVFYITHLAAQLSAAVVYQSTDHGRQFRVYTTDDAKAKAAPDASIDFDDFRLRHGSDIVATSDHCREGFVRQFIGLFPHNYKSMLEFQRSYVRQDISIPTVNWVRPDGNVRRAFG